MMNLILSQSEWAKEIGLFVIRTGIGLIFIRHGFPKLLKGTDEWQWLGSQMANLGITFAPVMWGFVASCTEFFGGISLTLGLGTRLATPFMAFAMFVAVIMHVKKGDPWGYISHPLALMVVFIGLMIAGSGKYSLDYYLSRYL